MITWQTRIRDLQAAGLTLSDIAEEIGIATSSVGDIATGRTKEPGGDAALKLYALHKKRCTKRSSATAA